MICLVYTVCPKMCLFVFLLPISKAKKQQSWHTRKQQQLAKRCMLVSISKPESKYHITWFFPFISGKQCPVQSSYTRCQNIANSLIVYLSWSYWCSWGLFNLQCHSNFCWKISWRKYFQLFSNSQVSSVCPPPLKWAS